MSSCEITVNGGESEEGKDGKVQNGFSYESLETTINGLEFVLTNEVIAGEKLMMKFNGLSNATQKDGYVHVGIAIKVYDDAGNLINESEDLLSHIEQQDPDINYVEAFVKIPEYSKSKEIRVVATLFDKYGTVSYDFDDTYQIVQKDPPSTTGVIFKTNLEDVSLVGQVFRESVQFSYAPIEVDAGETIVLYVKGMKGFAEENGDVDMIYSQTMTNENGDQVFVKEDKLVGSVEGYESYPISFNITLANFEPGQYFWEIRTKDTKSDKYLDAFLDVIVK